MNLDELITLVTTATGMLMIITIITLLWRMFRRWGRVVDAILGAPKSQGLPERPGIIQKVDTLYDTVIEVKDKLDDHISWHTVSVRVPNLNGSVRPGDPSGSQHVSADSNK